MKTLILSLVCASLMVGPATAAWAGAAEETVTITLTSDQLAAEDGDSVNVTFTRDQANKIQTAFPEWTPTKTITIKKSFIFGGNKVTLKYKPANNSVYPVPRSE